ncbi:RES domain-containing protein [Phyllobacterium phragmitis]|uniref:RES domain-containing protein n=1 Tax=Phyllobacterium phragmitis TaxID=2670329 RepID=A0A2S9IMG8_9HYPH|nr:RES family NAD+ phosphorylase [Phyllobacterium phragmitis]PRD41721.1 RES domain-containing protein [Phyllobacterium phragmitis]
MTFDQRILRKLVVRVRVDDYVRILAREHANNPLGMGLGRTRFSSPRDKFKLLYLAQDVKTAIAETIIRDRFEGNSERLLLHEEFDRYSVTSVRNSRPLLLLDLRYEGASLLGVSTDAVRAKAQTAGRRFSQRVYDQTNLDGIVYMSRITNKQCVAVYDRAVETSLDADSPATNLPELGCLSSVIEGLHITIIKRQ